MVEHYYVIIGGVGSSPTVLVISRSIIDPFFYYPDFR
jgi:hypothetical protein